MIKKRLIQLSGDSMKHVIRNVLFQWLGLCSNMILVFSLAYLINGLFSGGTEKMLPLTLVILAAVAARMAFIKLASGESTLASKSIKRNLREKIYEKLLRLGPSYNDKVSTAEVVQVTVEGVDQLETYFGAYLPQLFYSLLAPLTLFLVLSFFSLKAALVLFICVPLIPVSIVVVQKVAKKLLAKYWGQYAKLGDSFLENMQGLTTLKIYQADAYKQEEMNRESEHFRRVTMKVLTMQLNSIIVMDIVALGGAAAGIIMALSEFQNGKLTLFGVLSILLLAADFFLPMRQLGSYFHIAMNGMAASDKIFRLLDLEEKEKKQGRIGAQFAFHAEKLAYSYEDASAGDSRKMVPDHISFDIQEKGLTAFVGKSGCGKSTIASLLCGRLGGYEGTLTFGGTEVSQINEEELMRGVTVVSMNSYLFGGTVRENLLMAKKNASEEELWKVLELVKLADFLRTQEGLDTKLMEAASNFSGGQKQRLATARALLHDSPVYIFDEAASNVDMESEEQILQVIYGLVKEKTIIMISHRLASTVCADRIYVLKDGRIMGHGTHEELLKSCETYEEIWESQRELESCRKGAEI